MRGSRFVGVVGRSSFPRYFFILADLADNIYLASNMGNPQAIVWDDTTKDHQPATDPGVDFDPGTSTTRWQVLREITVLGSAAGASGEFYAFVEAEWSGIGGVNPNHTAGTATLEFRFLDASLAVIDSFSEVVDLASAAEPRAVATNEVVVPAGGFIEARITFTGADPAVDLEIAVEAEMYYRG